MIGCDPEFALVQDGDVVSPYDSFDYEYEDDESLDDSGGSENKWTFPPQYGDSIGSDGDNAELRPPPGMDANELVNNIHRLLFAANYYTKGKLEFKAGSYGMDALGGHIHFDWIDKAETPKTKTFQRTRQGYYRAYEEPATRIDDTRTGFLDLMVALPLALVENPTDRKTRVEECNYGVLGDAREQGFYGWEYRTLPSWLVSRYWASAVLNLAEVVNAVPLKDQKSFLNDNWWAGRILKVIWGGEDKYDYENTQRWPTESKKLFGAVVYPMWKKLAMGNPKLRGLLKPWLDLIHSDKHWDSDKDLLPQWGVASPLDDGIFVEKGHAQVLEAKVKSVLENVRPKGGVCFFPQDGGDVEVTRVDRRSTNPLFSQARGFWDDDLAQSHRRLSFIGLSRASKPKQIESTLKLL